MVRVSDALIAARARPIALVIISAVLCNLIAIAVGLLGSLSYFEGIQPIAGMTLQHLRPLHTTFAVFWIYLGGVAIVYYYLDSREGERSAAFWARFRWQMGLWAIAALGLLFSLSSGRFSGREYLGGELIWSLLIYAGWILFAWNFFSVVGFDLRGKPAYVYMWTTSLVLFLWVFAEGHLWRLSFVGDHPLRDIAFQWKSYGPLVGTFNMLVYGALGFLACEQAGSTRQARSRIAFVLLFVGLLNSFTNFGHHTYHLPQSHLVKWVSCIISLTESIIVAKLLLDLTSHLLLRRSSDRGIGFLSRVTTFWAFFLVAVAVAISVPPLNTLIHGTHFVMGHAMGMMIGIDSMALWTVLLFVIGRIAPARAEMAGSRTVIGAFAFANVGLLALVLVLSAKGIVDGYLRYLGPVAPAPPAILALFPQVFVAIGAILASAVLVVNVNWLRALIPLARRTRVQD